MQPFKTTEVAQGKKLRKATEYLRINVLCSYFPCTVDRMILRATVMLLTAVTFSLFKIIFIYFPPLLFLFYLIARVSIHSDQLISLQIRLFQTLFLLFICVSFG